MSMEMTGKRLTSRDDLDAVPIMEATKRLGVSRYTVYSWIERGLIDTLRFGPTGRTVLIPNSEIDRILRGGK